MQLHDFLDANFTKRSGDLFRKLDWLPLKDDVNLQKCRLTLRRIKTNETIQAIQRTLLPEMWIPGVSRGLAAMECITWCATLQ